MKIAAIIGDFETKTKNNPQIFQQVKSQLRADSLIAVTSGAFLQAGHPSVISKQEKTAKLIENGVDLVLELPVYCTLTSLDTYAFSAVSLLEKLGCVQELAILCRDVDEALLTKIVQFLFIESKEYQDEIRKCRKDGMGFYHAQAEVVGRHIPGAKEVLSHPDNICAVEYAKAMKRLYSTVKPRFINVPSPAVITLSIQNETRRQTLSLNLGKRLSAEIDLWTPKEREKKLTEISGATAAMTAALLQMHQAKLLIDLYLISEKLATSSLSEADVRRYLLRILVGVRQVEISICGLYSYALYVKVLGAADSAAALLSRIQKDCWIPVLTDSIQNAPVQAQELDLSRQMLLALDDKSDLIYTEIHQ